MKAGWFLASLIVMASQLPAQTAVEPVIQVDYSNPGLSPSQWTLTLHPDGSGHFRSEAANDPNAGRKMIETPSVDRDIQVSASFSGDLFKFAARHKWFNETCESHMKVAFQGWKTFTYTGPQGKGACTFNYSKDKETENWGESLEAVATTVLEGERLEVLLQHDRLGLDAETDFLTQAANDGRAQEMGAIRETLEKLASDDAVLERVRKRARNLLEHAAH